jgi:hypothetical protein
MLNKAFVSFSVLVFFLTSVFVLPAVSEDVAPQTDKSISKEAPKKNTEINKLEVNLPTAPPPTADKTASEEEKAVAEIQAFEPASQKSTLLRDVENAIAVNCAINPIACIFSIPFLVKDAVEFISDAVKKGGDNDAAKTEEAGKEEVSKGEGNSLSAQPGVSP